MSNLTSGCDLAAHISEEFTNAVIAVAYYNEQIAHSITRPFDAGIFGSGTISADIGVPSIEFDLDQRDNVNHMWLNKVRLFFPFDVQCDFDDSNRRDLLTGELAVETSATKGVIRLLGEEEREEFLSINLQNLASEETTIVLETEVENPEDVANFLKSVLIAGLQEETEQLALTPLPNGTIGYFNFVINNDISAADKDSLYLMMNKSDSETPLPATIPGFHNSEFEYSLAVEASLVTTQLSAAVEDVLDGPLPCHFPEDDSLILHDLNIGLADGHLEIDGKVEKDQAGPNPTVEFSGPVYLGMRAGDIIATADPDDFSDNLPWWLDSLHFLFPILGSIIVHAIGRAIQHAIASAAAETVGGGAIGLLAFSDTIPEVSGRAEATPVTLSPHNLSIDVLSEGIVLFGDFNVPLYIGNSRTLELHRYRCQWVRLMKNRRKRVFIDVSEALNQGYNGCWFCLRRYDTDRTE